MKLYLYDHCPFCVRALMAAHYKHVDVETVILLNDDVETCLRLVKAKQVPILEFDDGSAMPESLDIAHKFDEIGEKNRIIGPKTESSKIVSDKIATVMKSISSLLYPRVIKVGMPEFATQGAIDYFQTKKEKSIGKSFDIAMTETAEHKAVVEAMLQDVAKLVLSPDPFDLTQDDSIGWDDIFVFPVLRNLTVVKDLQFPALIADYIKEIGKRTNVSLYYDCAL